MTGEEHITVSESRQERLLRTGAATPRFLQGVFPFAGRGLFELRPLDDALHYVVPAGHEARIVYFRAGNHADDLVYLALAADGHPVRYFPVSPKGDLHVALAIVESYPAGTRLEVVFAAERGLTGTLIVDAGILELSAGERP
jgi:assimilatory nitrate reductase catalytic subunit